MNTKLRTSATVLAIALQSVALWWMVAVAVPDGNDVYWFNQIGSQALLDGQNPYGLEYQNIYGEGTNLYAQEVQEGDHLTFGYPYPPLSLLVGLPGYVLAGDYRFAGVIAVGATGLLAFFARPGAVSAAAAILLTMSPLTLRLVLNGWTEVFVGLGVAGVAFTAIRLPRAVPYLLGLTIAMKQYVVPLWLLALLFWRGASGIDRRTIIIAPIAIALTTVLPFLIWSPGDFLFSVIELQGLQPFRLDSASILGMIARAGGPQLPTWVGFVTGGAALAFVAWRAPRTAAGLCAASAFGFLAFFLFSKQAFMNYYYFVFVLLLFSIATSKLSQETVAASSVEGSSEALGLSQ